MIQPINAPTDLQAINMSNEIRLTWEDNSDNEKGFIIERKQGDSSSVNNFINIDTTVENDTSYDDKSINDTLNYTYRIFAYNNDTTSSFSNCATAEIISSVKGNNIIKKYKLLQNYPNPFNPTTKISYQIPKAGYVRIKLFNSLGQKVETLVSKYQSKGTYALKLDASDLASGIYFYQLKVNQFVSVKKLVVIR